MQVFRLLKEADQAGSIADYHHPVELANSVKPRSFLNRLLRSPEAITPPYLRRFLKRGPVNEAVVRSMALKKENLKELDRLCRTRRQS